MGKKKKRAGLGLFSRTSLAFIVEGLRQPGYTLFDAVHGYIYGRFPYLYIGIGVGTHPAARLLRPFVKATELAARLRPPFRLGLPRRKRKTRKITFADTYHGKVVPLQAATQLVQVNEPIKLRNLEKIIPYARARDIVLKNPDHIVALVCPCRSARTNPCLPLDVCLIVGEPFASFTLESQPQRARAITSQEAVEILRQEDERGHAHHAFFKDAMLGRFYAICNCCSCCCGALNAHHNGTPMLASSGYTAHIDEELCLACGECQDACQFFALQYTNPDQMETRLYGMFVDETRCMGCGVCISQCQQSAITLQRDFSKSEPLEIMTLLQSVGSTQNV
jgi:ferredoxin